MLNIIRAVGLKAPNDKNDVTFIQRRLIEIKKLKKPAPTGSVDDATLEAIWDFQDHFMLTPDGVISPNGRSVRFLNSWSEKTIGHGVNLSVGRLREAWNLVNPLLPKYSYCSSGFRSADEQRRLLQGRFKTFKNEIVAKYGSQKYDDAAKDLLKNEKDVHAMVNGIGQTIAMPGKSKHQSGKAIDLGGSSVHSEIKIQQIEIVKLVARANPDQLSGFVIPERNGCVHFELR